jgi:hypothetical protein
MAQGERERSAMSTTLLAGANSSEQALPAAFSWRRYPASNGQVFDADDNSVVTITDEEQHWSSGSKLTVANSILDVLHKFLT